MRSKQSTDRAPPPPRPNFAGITRSPCISQCRIDPADGYCEGCYRTIDEIAGWASMGLGERSKVWDALSERRLTKTSSTKTSESGR